uniref:Chloramphenicol acetyltransferase (catB) n=1 Tax=Clostridium butyricum TaxID=1492 RepID=Q45852_CLOBU|nr:putative [Clostridium butyricum]
MARSRKKAF